MRVALAGPQAAIDGQPLVRAKVVDRGSDGGVLLA
jgi:hypothetical protein